MKGARIATLASAIVEGVVHLVYVVVAGFALGRLRRKGKLPKMVEVEGMARANPTGTRVKGLDLVGDGDGLQPEKGSGVVEDGPAYQFAMVDGGKREWSDVKTREMV